MIGLHPKQINIIKISGRNFLSAVVICFAYLIKNANSFNFYYS